MKKAAGENRPPIEAMGYSLCSELRELREDIPAMNATSRAILQVVLSTDSSLSPVERTTFRDLVEGRVEARVEAGVFDGEHLTQKKAATLSVTVTSKVNDSQGLMEAVADRPAGSRVIFAYKRKPAEDLGGIRGRIILSNWL